MSRDIEFVPYDDTFLSLSRDWLNDPEIKALTMTPSFTPEMQARWYQSLPGRQDYLIWGVRCESRPVGVCGLKGIGDGTGEYWGYIGDKSAWGRGIGSRMVEFVEDHARGLGLETLWLRVWDGNDRARRLYDRLGFRPDGVEGDATILRKSLR